MDGDSSAVVEVLGGLDILFIVHKAVDIQPALALRFSDLVVQIKPFQPANLVEQLEFLIAARERAIGPAAGVA